LLKSAIRNPQSAIKYSAIRNQTSLSLVLRFRLAELQIKDNGYLGAGTRTHSCEQKTRDRLPMDTVTASRDEINDPQVEHLTISAPVT
jgi:hypothetical protein